MHTWRLGLRRLGRSLITFQPAPGRARRALRWVAAIALGLIGTVLILGPARGSLGLLGAMAANAGREAPVRRRARMLLTIGATTLICQGIGILTAPHPALIPPVMTVMTLTVVWAWHALQAGPPGPINTVFAGAFGTYMGSQGWTIPTLVPITALAWALGATASLLLLALDPHAPERESVEAAERAVDTHCDSPEPADGGSGATGSAAGSSAIGQRAIARSRAWISVDDAWHVLRTGRTPGTVPLSAQGRDLEERLRRAHLRLVSTLHDQSFPGDHLDITKNFDLVPMGLPSARYLLRTAAQRGSRPRLVAGRAATAVLLASSAALLSPVGHPYWAILSSLIVLHMGASRADLTVRAAHRVVGTALGTLVYMGIIALEPPVWLRLCLVIAAVYGLESIVTRNYAVAVVFVTVFALMLTPTASSAQIAVLMRDRVLETAIGAGAAVLVTWSMGRRAPVLLVRRQYRLTLDSIVTVLADLADGLEDTTVRTGEAVGAGRDRRWRPVGLLGAAGRVERHPLTSLVREHRRHLVFELGRAGAVLSSARPDDPAALGPWRGVQREVSTLGYDVVAATWRDPGANRRAAARAYTELVFLIATLPPISSRNIAPGPLASRVAAVRAVFLTCG